MLRNIIIMATSGLVLFSKEFLNGIAQPRLVGSLITAIIEFGQQTTGMGVSFIELSNVSISIITNEGAKIFCALFYDKDDGIIFGRLLCNEILNAFTQEYSSDFTQFGRNLKDFYGFHKKIPNIIRLSVKPIIQQLAISDESICKAVLVNDREIIDISGVRVDQLSVLANLSSLLELCSDIMGELNDVFQHLSLEAEDRRVLLWRVQEKSVLIVVVERLAPVDRYMPHIEEALEMVEQVCLLYGAIEAISK